MYGEDIFNIVSSVLGRFDKGYRTADIVENDDKPVFTGEIGNIICKEIDKA